MTVSNYHTYFVGETGVWVHNGKCDVHGNSKMSTKKQHGYEIYEKKTGFVQKTGISGKPLNKNGTSPRANAQVNKENKKEGYEKYGARVKKTNINGRAKALKWEQKNTNRLYAKGQPMDLHRLPKRTK